MLLIQIIYAFGLIAFKFCLILQDLLKKDVNRLHNNVVIKYFALRLYDVLRDVHGMFKMR